MKRCPDCERDIDKHSVACQYCGRVLEERKKRDEAKALKEQQEKKDR